MRVIILFLTLAISMESICLAQYSALDDSGSSSTAAGDSTGGGGQSVGATDQVGSGYDVTGPGSPGASGYSTTVDGASEGYISLSGNAAEMEPGPLSDDTTVEKPTSEDNDGDNDGDNDMGIPASNSDSSPSDSGSASDPDSSP